MDDGKCLLDVISDPQALKEFFRSTSQIEFVEGKVPPLTDEIDNKPATTTSSSGNEHVTFSTYNSQSANNRQLQSSSSSNKHLNEKTKPLAHFSFNSGNTPGNFLGDNPSLTNNGVKINDTGIGNLTSASNTRTISLSGSTQNLVTSSVPNVNNSSSTKTATVGIPSSKTTLSNAPLSFAFNDAGKAKKHLSTGSTSVLTVDKPNATSPKQGGGQQLQKVTPPRSSSQTGPTTTVRSQNIKASPLPTLKPKGVVPRPQNSSNPGGQNTSHITIQGNVLTQGLKTTPIKVPSQLVAIRPKIVIAQSNANVSGLSSQTVSTARPKQGLQNTFTLGAKGQSQLTKQILSNVPVPQLKQGVPNQPIGKSSLANLVQLQPKQIAPKLEQVFTVPNVKGKLASDQAQLQLVQSLIAQSQSQFGLQSNAAQKDLKALGQDGVTQQQKIVQQNQMKKIFQQNQLVQQALQVRAQQQLTQSQTQLAQTQKQQQQLTQTQQQQQLPQTQQQQQLTQTQQQQLTQTQQQQQLAQTQQQQQNMALLQMKNTPQSASTVMSTQVKNLAPSATINAVNLASQLREAINNKQLQQFLEKNPIVAQQLKQLNMRQTGLAANSRQSVTLPTSSATAVNTVTQLQKPMATIGQPQKATVNQLQTAAQLQKSTVTQGQKPTLTVGQLQKPVIVNQLSTPATNITQVQHSGTAQIQKAGTTDATVQIAKPTATPATSVKVVSMASTSQVAVPSTGQTTVQKPGQKPVATQKVVIVQNTSAGAVPTVSAGQPKVLLQTKEGRPILISQEQFRQIQAQLASKNLSIQGKLVTTTPVVSTAAATTAKPHVVVKTEAGTKATQKVLPAATKAPNIKQEVTKGVKRPIKTVETEESKLIKKVKLTIQKDQNDVCFTDIHKPFKSQQDTITRLTPYHVYSEPIPNARMQRKANMLLDKLALQLTYKSDKMINKYRQLLLNDMQRDVPSAEVVMVNRIYLADEKAALSQKKQTMLQEAKQMAEAARATLSQMKSSSTTIPISTETTTTDQLSTTTTDQLSTHTLPDTSEPIEISDDDSSPITSANNFLTQISNTRTDLSNNMLEPG